MNNATISLGKPITAPVLVPVEHKSTPTCINNPFMVGGECYRVTAMSLGTPHGAVLVDNVDSIDVQTLGRALGTHVLFPEGASIVFIQVLDKKSVKARLWQRGEGETPFSVEAACVAGTAAMMLQRILTNEVTVHMGGNTFEVDWNRVRENVTLTVPADMILGIRKAAACRVDKTAITEWNHNGKEMLMAGLAG